LVSGRQSTSSALRKMPVQTSKMLELEARIARLEAELALQHQGFTTVNRRLAALMAQLDHMSARLKI
jgi:uncharacterized coiled-coil protein SlyX